MSIPTPVQLRSKLPDVGTTMAVAAIPDLTPLTSATQLIILRCVT